MGTKKLIIKIIVILLLGYIAFILLTQTSLVLSRFGMVMGIRPQIDCENLNMDISVKNVTWENERLQTIIFLLRM